MQKNCTGIAVPIGTAALDEVVFWTKARTLFYLPSKPDKYVVRFYALVGNDGPYLSSIMDNRKGNTINESGPENYCKVFRNMNGPFKKLSRENSSIDPNSSMANWAL